MVDRITTRTLHLQRTSEANKVPAEWARAEIARVLGSLSAEQRSAAVIVGWAGCSLEYQHAMTDLEYERALREQLAADVRLAIADGVITPDELAQLAASAQPRT